jgi:hypothetical protein
MLANKRKQTAPKAKQQKHQQQQHQNVSVRVCEKCDATFSIADTSELVEHMRIEHSIDDFFPCDMCSFSTESLWEYQEHMSSKHSSYSEISSGEMNAVDEESKMKKNEHLEQTLLHKKKSASNVSTKTINSAGSSASSTASSLTHDAPLSGRDDEEADMYNKSTTDVNERKPYVGDIESLADDDNNDEGVDEDEAMRSIESGLDDDNNEPAATRRHSKQQHQQKTRLSDKLDENTLSRTRKSTLANGIDKPDTQRNKIDSENEESDAVLGEENLAIDDVDDVEIEEGEVNVAILKQRAASNCVNPSNYYQMTVSHFYAAQTYK